MSGVIAKNQLLAKEEFDAKREAEKQRQKPETRSHNIVIQDADGMYRCKEAGCAYVTSTNHAFREHRSICSAYQPGEAMPHSEGQS